MKTKMILSFALLAMAGTAQAEGDVEEGKKTFERRCRACHMIQDDAGEAIQRGGRTGPNLFGVVGRTAGTEDGFRYRDSIVEAGEKGLVWDEASLEAYVQDPSGFLQEFLDDKSARSGMTFKLREGMEDVYAYLATFSN
ncbi:cytochrome C [Salipiger sp. CCB-MM3]|uniref:c-type cytochrome n=1 Tax=Salipiger sp. CCB-MM3 TaxID=1792508 RepID=UPI00080ABAB8|nr:c-type cytochrome [Salipiger sp. CCB-MM3]ANT61503.1 cytochrome C [Salipiger sp. CCB-MM3]